MSLALDIDDTLADTSRYCAAEAERRFGGIATKEALAWLDARAYSNEEQKLLPVMPGAVVAVAEIQKITPIACYLTSRPEKVHEGTREWLRAHSFPDAPIIQRKASEEHVDGLAWKIKILEERFPAIRGIIDNSPEIVGYKGSYKGLIFLYGVATTLYDAPGVVSCPAWGDVVQAVKKNETMLQ